MCRNEKLEGVSLKHALTLSEKLEGNGKKLGGGFFFFFVDFRWLFKGFFQKHTFSLKACF